MIYNTHIKLRGTNLLIEVEDGRPEEMQYRYELALDALKDILIQIMPYTNSSNNADA